MTWSDIAAFGVVAALKQGRIDAAVQGSETLPYAQANEPGKYRVIGEPIAQGLQGIASARTRRHCGRP